MNLSYWEKEYWYDIYDFVIVGAGIVGLTTALELNQRFPKAKIGIIERGAMPAGASTKNAGFACFGTVGEILDDLTDSSEDEVINTIKSRWQGLQRLKQLTSEYDIEYKNYGGEEVFLTEEEYTICNDKVDYINKLIHSAIGLKNVIVSRPSTISHAFSYGLFNNLEAQLNPVLMVKSFNSRLAQAGVDIMFNTFLSRYEKCDNKYLLKINDSIELRTKSLILCTNAFTRELCEIEDIIPARNQVLVTAPLSDLELKGTFHYNKGYVYFRNIEHNKVLIGGARHMDPNGEETSEFGTHNEIRSYLKDFLSDYILKQDFNIEYEWSGIIATGKSKKPIISKVADGLYVGARLGGMGVAIGSDVGYTLAQLIEETY